MKAPAHWMLMVCGIGLSTCRLLAQSRPDAYEDHTVLPLERWTVFADRGPSPAIAPGDSNDPAYLQYRKGYNLILDEHWREARKIFSELIARYPKSTYADDATYWSDFALKHLDQKKAVEAYERFIRERPSSRYLDDAVADLASLKAAGAVAATPSIGAVPRLDDPRMPATAVAPFLTPAMRGVEFNLRRMVRNMRHLYGPVHFMGREIFDPGTMTSIHAGKIDPETRLKIQALTALGTDKEDDKTFQTFRDIALDRRQPVPLRVVALGSLSRFRKHDVLPLFLGIASGDTNAELQSCAIYSIGDADRDRNRSVEVLVDLYRKTPGQRTEELGTILDAAASIGNDKALAFLTTVARTQENEELQCDAIDYIGQVEDEKNKSIEILKELYGTMPKDRVEARRTILYATAEIGNEKAVDFLIGVARTDENYDFRRDAVSCLGSIGGEKARSALYEILRGK